MIHFICCNCDKEIHGVTIMYDRTHFLHKECELEFKRKKIHEKWKASGLLDGLTGMNEEKSIEIEKLFGSDKSINLEV
jgi:hypothetical protein